MTSQSFCYWLQGLFELSDVQQLNEKQTELIRRHLNMVFVHEIDPSQGTPEHQAELSALHDGLKKLNDKVDSLPKNQHLIPTGDPFGPKMRC
jgi:hypothetical protein